MAQTHVLITLEEHEALKRARSDLNVYKARADRMATLAESRLRIIEKLGDDVEKLQAERRKWTGDKPVVVLSMEEMAELETARRLGEQADQANRNLAVVLQERDMDMEDLRGVIQTIKQERDELRGQLERARSIAHTRSLTIGDLRTRLTRAEEEANNLRERVEKLERLREYAEAMAADFWRLRWDVGTHPGQIVDRMKASAELRRKDAEAKRARHDSGNEPPRILDDVGNWVPNEYFVEITDEPTTPFAVPNPPRHGIKKVIERINESFLKNLDRDLLVRSLFPQTWTPRPDRGSFDFWGPGGRSNWGEPVTVEDKVAYRSYLSFPEWVPSPRGVRGMRWTKVDGEWVKTPLPRSVLRNFLKEVGSGS